MNVEDDLDVGDVRMLENEREYEDMFRPFSLRDFNGQAKAVKNLEVFVMTTRTCKKALDHVLLRGSPGLGKTMLSSIIVSKPGVGSKVTSGPALNKPRDLTGILTLLEKNNMLLTDEIHWLSPIVKEYLYSAIKDYRIDIVIDKGPNVRLIQIDSTPFILIGTTTRSGLLTSPLRARFSINMHLEYYDMETLMKIVLRSANILNVKYELDAAREIASRSRGTPRITNVLLRRVCDSAQIKGNGDIDEAIACFSLEVLNIDRYDLDRVDSKLLTTIIDKFQRGPVGLTIIATALGEDPGTLEEMYEPFLIKESFIKRTPRGRKVISLAYTHLGRSRVGEQGFLFD